MNTQNRAIIIVAVVAMAVFAGTTQAGQIEGQIGILTSETLAGNNPATGLPWAPGDQYRFAFHTSEKTTATSADITTYNEWVQGLANASTAYNIGAVDGVTWKAIGSTAEVDARDNTSTNPNVNGAGHAIFLLDGSTIVANNYADLWDGEIQNPIGITELGTAWTHWPWSGSYWDGTKAPGHEASFGALGDAASDIHQGQANATAAWIWRQWTGDPPGTELPMYALSEPLSISGDSDPTAPNVDAGVNMISWSGQPVQLDPNVVNNNVTPLTYLWSADPDDGVVFSATDIEAPTVTITKPATVLKEISISNAGFESPTLANGDFTNTPAGWANGHYDVTAPGVWVVEDSGAGVYNPSAALGYGGVAPEGENVGATTSYVGKDGGLSQVLSAKLEANTQYDLSVLVGNPFLFNASTATANYRVELLAGGVVVASDTGPSPTNDTTWKTAGLTYDSGDSPAQLGESLEIRLLAVSFTDNKGVDFDDVQLTAVGPTPEAHAVMLTLAVNNEGSTEPDVKDRMTIKVYDDSCKAAQAVGTVVFDSSDLNQDCITDFKDFALAALYWLNDYALTEPVPE